MCLCFRQPVSYVKLMEVQDIDMMAHKEVPIYPSADLAGHLLCHLPLYPSTHLPIYPAIYPSTYLHICPFTHLPIYPSPTYPSTSLPGHLPVYQSTHLPIYPSSRPSTYLPIYPFTWPSTHLPITNLPIYPSTPLPIYHFTHLILLCPVGLFTQCSRCTVLLISVQKAGSFKCGNILIGVYL